MPPARGDGPGPLGDPFLGSAVLAANALALAGTGPAAEALLAAVADGAAGDARRPRRSASGPTAHGAVEAEPVGDGYTLAGDGGAAIGAPTADVLIVAARIADGATGLFHVDPEARASTEPRPNDRRDPQVGTRRVRELRRRHGSTAADVAGELDRRSPSPRSPWPPRWSEGRSALEMTLGYLNEREQFGVLIGSFQALKHRIADSS